MPLVRSVWLFAAIASVVAADELRAEPVSPAETIILFNGRDLAGFYTWLVDSRRDDPRHVFSATNGMLRVSGEGLGYVGTVADYANYHLIAEFKWGTRNWDWGNRVGRARDSGIFLHTIGPDGNSYDGKGAFRAGIECQIFQGATGDILLIRGTNALGELIAPRITSETSGEHDDEGWPFWQRDGIRRTIVRWGRLNWRGKSRMWRDELNFRGAHDVEGAYGKWNRIECICDGARLRIILNGVTVNEAFDIHPAAGKILLQCEGSEIFFRKLELRPLKRRT